MYKTVRRDEKSTEASARHENGRHFFFLVKAPKEGALFK